MANMYVLSCYHLIFGTRNSTIPPGMAAELYGFIADTIRSKGGVIHAIGGMPDHIHIVMALPKTIALSEMLRLIKGGSSRWMNEQRRANTFAWQSGYAAFTVSESVLDSIIQYVRNQEEHHKKRTFREEYEVFLQKNRISYDEKYLFDD